MRRYNALKDYQDIYIIPLGGCGNVVKLFQIFVGFMSEKNEEASDDALFLIDTDKQQIQVRGSLTSGKGHVPISLRRLQIANNKIMLKDPQKGGEYSQTEIEDCLDPKVYYNAVNETIKQSKNTSIKRVFSKYAFVENAPTSVMRGDESCIRAIDAKYIPKNNKYSISSKTMTIRN